MMGLNYHHEREERESLKLHSSLVRFDVEGKLGRYLFALKGKHYFITSI